MKKFTFLISMCFLSIITFGQSQIKGKVSDEENNPLVGASIQVKGSSNGSTTDANGEYVLNLESSEDIIIEASYIGYETQEQNANVNNKTSLNFSLKPMAFMTEEIIVESTRAGDKTPVTYSKVSKEAIEKRNLGQDLPYMFSMEPSLVTTSDAGAGVGYTGLWIRGSNIQRINVTVNGIPLNDPESHGVFFVNMPDFASSVNSAQIQRGVGTSTNGGGAFGATINMETNNVNKKAFGEVSSSVGSFNTFRNNVQFGTGLLNNHWAFEGRLSKISSDGYIDRAKSDLKSFFVQGGYYSENTVVKAVIFSGKEKTYQAWNGVDQYTMDNMGRTFNPAGAIFGKKENGETDWWNYSNVASFYDNETDNYQQDNYQLHLSQKLTDNLNFTAALHYTYGRGYYEQYKQEADLGDYPIGTQYFGLDSTINNSGINTLFYHDTIQYADLIVKRWLDNHFYGGTFAFNYSKEKLDVSLGGAANKYANAKHYGEIIWAQFTGDTKINDKYYDNESNKTDFNIYLKADYSITDKFSAFVDLQNRNITYTMQGTDKGNVVLDYDEYYSFFNPKFGLTYDLENIGLAYASFAIANREPIRTDFTDAPDNTKPEPEQLMDVEFGIRENKSKLFYSVNGFYMHYTNQLALTGELNDVGSPIRENIGESSRMGIEIDGGTMFNKYFGLRANLALSSSNTDYKEEGENGVTEYNNVQLSFSPQAISGIELKFIPIKNSEISTTTKYVSKQYLDLTQNEDLALKAYSTTDLRLSYSIKPKFMNEIQFSFVTNNIFNSMYSASGYTYYGYAYYYPQAGINFLGGVTLKF